MADYYNSLSRGWNSSKRYPISDVSMIFMFGFLAVALIYGGVTIMNDEGIFEALYPEAFQVTVTPPTGLVLTNTSMKTIRKKSSLNLYLSYAMILAGVAILIFYVGHKLLF